MSSTQRPVNKPPLRILGVLFGIAMLVLFVTAAEMIVERFALPTAYATLATVAAPVLAGVLIALYVRTRGGVHALISSVIALPILTIVDFQGVWQPAVLAAAFCTLAAALTEIVMRRRTAP